MIRVRNLTGASLLAFALTASLSQAAIFVANLTGAQEVPPHASPGTGSATATLTGNVLSLSGSFSSLSASYTASHIHAAPAGANGGVAFGLTAVPAGPAGTWNAASNTFTLSAAQLATLAASGYYVNVHSLAWPGGEIRGQLLQALPQPVTDLHFIYDMELTQLDAIWSATANATSYRVESATHPGGGWSVEGITAGTSWTVTPPADAVRLYRVVALN